MQVKQASWSNPPVQSLDGDVLLTLNDSTGFRVHSQFLQQISPVLKSALACGRPPEHSGASSADSAQAHKPASDSSRTGPQLPLPGTSKQQALLLLHCLYSWSRESWLCGLPYAEILDLAMVADKFGCAPMLQLVDSCLVKACQASEPAWVSVTTAPNQFNLACQLHLPSFEAHVGRFLGRHTSAVVLKDLDAVTAAILQGARENCE